MKLFLSTDFEGTSGIVAWEQIIEGNAEYEQGRWLLTNEVNAVITGALEGGATEFVVNDSHHHMRNLHPQDLLGQARRGTDHERDRDGLAHRHLARGQGERQRRPKPPPREAEPRREAREIVGEARAAAPEINPVGPPASPTSESWPCSRCRCC